MLIIFEGMDKTGKTSLINEFNKRTNFKHIVLDRGAISSYVYDAIYERGNREKYDFFVDMVKKVPHIVFLCIAKDSTIMKRLECANEKLPEKQKEIGIERIKDLFLEETAISGLNFMLINTEYDFNETVDSLVNFIEEYEGE